MVKHVLAHIAGWDDASTSSLRANAGGEELATPAFQGVDHYNAETVSTRESLSYAQIAREWEQSREALKKAINDLPADKVDKPMLFPWGESGTAAELVNIFAPHERGHAAEIEELKQPT